MWYNVNRMAHLSGKGLMLVMEGFWIVLSAVLMISTLVLLLKHNHDRSLREEKQRYEHLLRRLLQEKRVTPQEILQEGLAVPPYLVQGTAAQQQQQSSAVGHAGQPQAAGVLQAAQPATQSLLQLELQKLRALNANGIITDEEFAAQKAKLFGQQAVQAPPAPAASETPAGKLPTPLGAPVPMPAQSPKPQTAPVTAIAAVQAPQSVAPKIPAPPQNAAPMPQPVPAQTAREPKKNTTSAISVMLGVGVVLIILAGLLFVRTSWNAMADFGKLMTLAAGSVLFFGTSALAYKLWNLKRTGMAFFSLGATFLPISVWAAGYLSLLGNGLSGGSNPWLLTIAAAAFTGTAAMGVKISREKPWGIATLIGFSATYLCGMWALMPSYGAWTLSAAAYALLLTIFAKPLSLRLPPCIGEVFGHFSMIYTICASVPMLIRMDGSSAWYGFAAFSAALAFVTPAVVSKLKQGSAVVMSLLTVYGFARVMQPLLVNEALSINGVIFTGLVCMITAVVLLVFITANTLPDGITESYHIMYRILSGIAIVIFLGIGIGGSNWNWLMLLGMVLLCVATLVPMLRSGNIWLRTYLAAELFVLALGFSNTVLQDDDASLLLMSALCFGCGILFLFVNRLRSPFSDFLYPIGMVFCANLVVNAFDARLWLMHFAAVILLAVAVIWCFLMAMEHRMQTVKQHAFGIFFVVSLALFCSGFGHICLRSDREWAYLIWTVLSAAIALGLHYRTKRGFAGVRHRIFQMCVFLPAVVGLFLPTVGNAVASLLLFVNAMIALGVYRIYASHGKRPLAVLGFAEMLFFAYRGIWQTCSGHSTLLTRYPALAAASLVPLLLGIGAYVIFRNRIRFVGDYAVKTCALFTMLTMGLLYLLLAFSVTEQMARQVLFAVIAAALYGLGYALFALRQEKPVATVHFAALLLAVLTACVSAAYHFLFADAKSGTSLYGSVMVCLCIFLMLGAVVFLIRRGKLHFTGDYAPDLVATVVLPAVIFLAPLFCLAVDLPLWQMLLAMMTALLGWLLTVDYAHRATKVLSTLSFFSVMCCVLQTVSVGSEHYLGQGHLTSCSVILCCYMPVLLIGIVSLLIRRGRAKFMGDFAVDFVAQTLLVGAVIFYGLRSLFATDQLLGLDNAVWLALTAALSALLLFLGFTASRKETFAAVSIGAALVMLMRSGYALGVQIGLISNDALMLAFGLLMPFALFAVLHRRGHLRVFSGSTAMERAVRVLTAAVALLFSITLMTVGTYQWHTFYYFFGLMLCIAAWFTAHNERIVGGCIAVFSLILSTEALRVHCMWRSNLYVACMLIALMLLFVLFCYLGIVLRSCGIRKGWAMTYAGGAVPLWLFCISFDGAFSTPQSKWVMFCAPLLLTAFLFYLGRSVLPDTMRRGCYTAAAALGTITLWMQPMFDFTGTYLAGKYHLLPLIAFGFALRLLYGREKGGNCLFAMSVYAVIRLAVQALMHEKPADLLTVLACGLGIFIIAYFIKQKKWFLLGGITLCGVAVRLSPRMHMQWWVYLLIAGAILIIIAAANEMAKQRGESLKKRVSRFWEDWEW